MSGNSDSDARRVHYSLSRGREGNCCRYSAKERTEKDLNRSDSNESEIVDALRRYTEAKFHLENLREYTNLMGKIRFDCNWMTAMKLK